MKGKTALVTCASNSFGAAIAKKLAQEGLKIILIARPKEDLSGLVYQIQEEGGEAGIIPADLFKEEDVMRVFHAVRDTYGQVDILVNHADLESPSGPSGLNGKEEQDDMNHHEMWKIVEMNIMGIIRLTQLVLADMISRNSGRIIYVEPAVKLFPALGNEGFKHN